MQSAIEITTLTGVRLDVYSKETIEIKMGGISLLSLSQRTVSYTNTFSLPSTPINNSVFEYCAFPERINKPIVTVWIRKGFFEQKATLKVIEFDKEYKCSVSYDYEQTIKTLSEQNFYSLAQNGITTIISDTTEPTDEEILTAVSDIRNDGVLFSPFCYRWEVGNAAISVLSFLSRITAITGITFSGDSLSDLNLLNTFIFNKYVTFQYLHSELEGTYYILQNMPSSNIEFISCSDVLKSLSQILLFDVIITGNNIELKLLQSQLSGSAFYADGFEFSKELYSSYGLENTVTYKVDKTVNEMLASDTFTADGVGIKKALEIKSFIPKVYEDTTSAPYIKGGYDPKDTEASKEIIIMAGTTFTATLNFRMSWPAYSLSSIIGYQANGAEPLNIAPAYSDIMTPIFTSPVILKASKYFYAKDANTIITNRLITSVQMGGTYWVDDMAYNLSTGNSVMTLIKIR